MICGIDPGLEGGVVFHAPHLNTQYDYKMPLIGNLVDVGRMQELFIQHLPSVVYIETQRAGGRQSGQHIIGINYGRLTAVCDLLDVDYVEITPQTWQKQIFGRLVGKKETKQHSIEFCLSHGYFVPMTSSRKDARYHDGVADAHCIAHYGTMLQGAA